MEIKELIKTAHENAVSKGFWNTELSTIKKIRSNKDFTDNELQAVINAFRNQRLLLVVSELVEAMEALRHNDWLNYKEELADVMIRMGDLAGGEDIKLHNEIAIKMERNKERPKLHGKAF
jgi:NTP pyrophosphatase (non-canonical NTP hydrolase)